jgi:hypothetical protein
MGIAKLVIITIMKSIPDSTAAPIGAWKSLLNAL